MEEFVCLNKIEEGTYGVVYRAKEKRNGKYLMLRVGMDRCGVWSSVKFKALPPYLPGVGVWRSLCVSIRLRRGRRGWCIGLFLTVRISEEWRHNL